MKWLLTAFSYWLSATLFCATGIPIPLGCLLGVLGPVGLIWICAIADGQYKPPTSSQETREPHKESYPKSEGGIAAGIKWFKKHPILAFIVGILIIFFALNGYNSYKERIRQERLQSAAQTLATWGEEQFLNNDFDNYLDILRKSSFSDMTLEIEFHYSVDDYIDDSHTLYLKGKIINLYSEKIDQYYTQDYNGRTATRLANIMQSLTNNIRQEYAYESNTTGLVVLEIECPQYGFTIETTGARKYEYVYGYINSVQVEIDGSWVFSKDINPYEKIPNTSTKLNTVPYYGMSASEVSHTSLGEPDEVELCTDFYLLRPERRSATYRWNDASGKMIFYAHAYGGKIIDVSDYR